jgi:hypothetical protein
LASQLREWGVRPSRAVNAGVVDSPEALEWFSELGEQRRKVDDTTAGGQP